MAVFVSSVFGAPKENDGAATFSSFFSVVLGAPKEKVGGAVFSSFFSVVLEAPKVKDGFGASDDGAADEVPKENFGAAAAGAASEDFFWGLGFGASQAGHFARSAALDIMQIEQVQLPLVAFFAFDMKSENPPATGAGIGVAISAGFGGAIFGFGASHAGHLAKLASLDIMQMSHTHLFFEASFCLDIKSPNPPAAGATLSAGLVSSLRGSFLETLFGFSFTSSFFASTFFFSLPKNFFFCS